MKNLIILVFLLAAAIVLGASLLMPAQPRVSETAVVHAPQGTVVRALATRSLWERWWTKPDMLSYPVDNFHNSEVIEPAFTLEVKLDKKAIPMPLVIMPLGNDSARVVLQVLLPESKGMMGKARNFFTAKRVAAGVDDLLQALKSFSEKEENIYGLKVQQVKVRDSILLTTTFMHDAAPGPAFIDSIVGNMKAVAQQGGAAVTGPVMMHFEKSGNMHLVMLGLPVDREVEARGDYRTRRMVMGNLLEAEVRGGRTEIEKGFRQMEKYIRDHRRTSPAIPFEVPLTNRMAEADSNKWLTRIYYPII